MTDIAARLASALADRYTIERELGQGGMATVYLADDLKHDRKVALKVLRPELAAVIGAERFLTEIKTTANLQHPHILPLFDSGEADSFLFYVMPFVEGETVRDRLDREKQLPVADAVRIASEVAAALDYAHRRDVIHRDIKPENILLHDGSALVADFGIALAASKAGDTRMTETGMSLGTPHYMSPEQAMGERDITARSDVYALGCVLYEMLLGEPPFTGPTAQSIVAKVLSEKPSPLVARRGRITPGIEDAVLTALEKLPADRFATAAEFAEALAGDGTSTTATRTGRSPVSSQPAARGGRLVWPVVATLLGVAALWGWLRPGPALLPSRQRVVLWVAEFPDFLSASSTRIEGRVTISPDGSMIVFADSIGDDTQLFLKQRNEAWATPIPGTEGGGGPFFSPDGEWIGYFVRGGNIRKVRTSGGGSIQLASQSAEVYFIGTWLDDGSIVFVDAAAGLSRVSDEGGPVTSLRAADARHGDDPSTLSPLPGSRGVLYTGCPGNCASGSAVYVFDIAGDTSRVLIPGATGGWYAPTGHLLYTGRDGGLFAVGFDLDRMTVTSGPISIAEGVAPNGFTMSASGTAILALGTRDLDNSTLVWVWRDGTEEPFAPDWTGAFEYPALSPDGSSIAVSVREAVTQLWVRRDDGSRLRISHGDMGSWRPSWTSDGSSFAFATTAGASSASASAGNDVYLSPMDGSAPPRLLVDLDAGIWEAEFSRDGEWLVVRADDAASYGVFLAGRLRGDTTLSLVLSDSSFNAQLALSPDSRWLAFKSDRTGRSEVYVASFPDMLVRYQVSQGGGTEPRWAHNGRELFFKSRGRLMSLPVAPGAGFAPGNARPLFSVAEYADAVNRPQYDVGPDDRRFVMIRRPARESRQEVVLVENFFADLTAKMAQ